MLELIRERRSVRRFTSRDVPEEIVEKIVEAGRWAPSGKNNQPWKFAIIRDKEIKELIARQTIYSRSIREAPVLILVFLDNSLSYDRTKDVQAIGACIQNMLLAIHSLGLGGVWLGEILKNKEKVREIVEAPSSYELMAVIAFGYPAEALGEGERKSLSELVFLRK